WAKLTRGPELFVAILQGLGVPAPELMAWVVIVLEIAGGLLVLSGAFINIVSVPLAILLLTVVFSVHLPFGFISVKLKAITAAGPQFGPPGVEVALLYLVGLATLILGGPGPLSLRARK